VFSGVAERLRPDEKVLKSYTTSSEESAGQECCDGVRDLLHQPALLAVSDKLLALSGKLVAIRLTAGFETR